MIKSRLMVAGTLLAMSAAVSAEVTVTPTVATDYDFRGISQTAKDPAFQLNLNYAHDSGFYAGVWGSNVNFGPGDPNVELDLFAGFAGGDAEASFGYDVGAVYYSYPSASPANYTELYAGITKGWFGGKFWFSPDIADTTAWYLEGNGTFPLPNDFSLLAHVGYSDGNYWDDGYGDGYFDWSVGVSKSFGNFSATLKFIDGSDLPDLDDAGCTGSSLCDVFSTDNKVVLSISTTLPWASE